MNRTPLAILSILSILSFLFVLSFSYADNDQIDVIITFNSSPGNAGSAAVQAAGGTVKTSYHLLPAIAASIPAGAMNGLLNNPNVLSVEIDGTVHATDAELDNTWGVKHIGAGDVHSQRLNTGAGVRIGIIDSGVDGSHVELTVLGGYDFVNGDTDPSDDAGHGTHVAGTVAAADDDLGVVGVAPGAEIYALKVLDSSGSGSFNSIISAVQWCVDNGIEVTNNSYGSSQNPGGAVETAFINADAAGVLNIASAGNSGRRNGKGNTVGFPARYASVVAVAATDSSDNRASFSSTGSTVEIAAPGVLINSTKLGGGYVVYNGTSMACPHVVGTAALVLAAGIADAGGNGRLNDDVRLRLQQTAVDIGDAGRDNYFGYGLVDAFAAADIGPVDFPPIVTITSPADAGQFSSGATIAFEGSANDDLDGDLSAALAWSSSIDGVIGSGASVSAVLSDGSHIITASATDSGSNTGSASVSIVVGTPNVLPTVTILSPGDGSSFASASVISFSGSANDPEDGDIGATLSWTSNINGAIGGGGSFSTALSDGVHQITASVIDSDGGSGSAVITVTVGSATVSVSDISYAGEGGKNSDRHLKTTVFVVDNGGSPVAGALVSIILSHDGGSSWTGSATTGTAGSVTFTLKNAPNGCFTSTASVSAPGLTFDGLTPPNQYCK